MKRQSTDSAKFGLSQHEMAIILNVKPSQYSMYESGLRELPTSAMILLTQIIIGIHLQEPSQETEPDPTKQKQMTKQLEDWGRYNQKQILAIERKIAREKNKKEIAEKILPLVQFLNGEGSGLVQTPVLSHLNLKSKWDSFDLLRLEVRLGGLLQERKKILDLQEHPML